MSEELIHGFEVKLARSTCHPDADWYGLFIKLHEDISEVLPYLNAELEQPTDYRQSDRILLWNYRDKKYAFRPCEIAIAPVCDDREAQELTDSIIETVNNIWKRKDEITPSFEGRKPLPKVLDIYKLLPRSNCRKCGFPTCMAFAVELRMDSMKLSLCPYLSERDFEQVVPGRNAEPVA
jgi:ArsR family metal-binding transcriptional regulator